IKAVWIMGTNPVDSLPEADAVKEALKTCPFVVVSDIVKETDTTLYADVRLPSEGWGEKEGLVTNSERRISRQQKFLQTPGGARADWWQLVQVAKRLGFEEAFDFPDAASIAKEYAALSAFENQGSRDFDIGGIAEMTAAEFSDFKPVQWPYRRGEQPSETRFFADGQFYTPDRKAQFCPPTGTAKRDPFLEYSFTLNTGRIRDQWHTMTRTGKSPRLSQHLAEPFAEIHPVDVTAMGIRDGDLVEIYNDFGSIVVRARLSERSRHKSVFVPMHWTDQFASNARLNGLVPALVDPFSGQPATKNIPCAIRPFVARYYGFMITRDKPVMTVADYWSLAKCTGGWRTEFAGRAVPNSYAQLARDLIGTGELIAYQDLGAGEYRYAIFENEQLKAAVYLSSSRVSVSRAWLVDQFASVHENQAGRYQVLAGRPGKTGSDNGAIVCSCFSIGRNQILSA